MNILCTICARAGSKGVANKNLRLINGIPLIAYSIRHALDSKLFSQVVVSSDSKEILATATERGATFTVKRPIEMASDTSPKLPAIKHCVEQAEMRFGEFEIVVDLDATAPLRTVSDIFGALDLLTSTNADNVITGCVAHRSPYFNLVEVDEAGLVSISKSGPQAIARRQDSPQCFDMNASIYVWRRNALFDNQSVISTNTRIFQMPQERSFDIDSELDFEMVEWMILRDSKS